MPLAFYTISAHIAPNRFQKMQFLTIFLQFFFLLHRIVHITRDTLVNPGQTAELICEVDANPITADTVKWTRDGFDFDGRTKITASGNKFYLNVINVTEADEGKFSCKVNNGIGDEVTNTTFLLVRRKYYDSFLYLDIYELIRYLSSNYLSIIGIFISSKAQ